jgi:hypothetical protein
MCAAKRMYSTMKIKRLFITQDNGCAVHLMRREKLKGKNHFHGMHLRCLKSQ